MESSTNSCVKYGLLVKDLARHSHPRRMGLSERSKTFTIESLLKSDQNVKNHRDCSSAPESPPQPTAHPDLRLAITSTAEDISRDLLSRLDFNVAAANDPQFLHWLRLHHNQTSSSSSAAIPGPPLTTHYLPGNYGHTRLHAS